MVKKASPAAPVQAAATPAASTGPTYKTAPDSMYAKQCADPACGVYSHNRSSKCAKCGKPLANKNPTKASGGSRSAIGTSLTSAYQEIQAARQFVASLDGLTTEQVSDVVKLIDDHDIESLVAGLKWAISMHGTMTPKVCLSTLEDVADKSIGTGSLSSGLTKWQGFLSKCKGNEDLAEGLVRLAFDIPDATPPKE